MKNIHQVDRKVKGEKPHSSPKSSISSQIDSAKLEKFLIAGLKLLRELEAEREGERGDNGHSC